MLFFVVFLAALLRFQGLDWDQNQHLQPDERYISMVLSSLSPPKSFSEYLDPNRSPLSPYTHGFGAYIYGQLPLTALAYLSRWFGMEGYDKTYLLGRGISAILDTLSIVLVYKLGRRLWNERVGVIGAGFYAVSPLAIQYSHFMVMESWVTFSWLMVILTLMRLPRVTQSTLVSRSEILLRRTMTGIIGILLGVSLAIKFSSILLLPLVFLLIFLDTAKKPFIHRFLFIVFCSLFTVFSFRFFQPTIFSSASWLDWSFRSDFLQAFNFQKQAIEGKVMFPPQWQWVKTPRLWFPLENVVLWGMGPVTGILAVIGITWQICQIRHISQIWNKDGQQKILRVLMAGWILAVFIWQGGQFVKTMRYFLPLFPLLALFAAHAINAISLRSKRSDLARSDLVRSDLVRKIVLGGSIVISGLWALMFTSIYRTTTTRIVASEWMYQNIPDGSKIMLEEWDDPLPLLLPGYLAKRYISAMEPVYTPDDEKKKMIINEWTNRYDWIVLSSPRAKGSIGKLSKQFPLMSRFYKDLESGTLGFVKAAEFTSFPRLDCSLLIAHCSLTIDDSSAEESFWVYDHPKVEIYQKISL